MSLRVKNVQAKGDGLYIPPQEQHANNYTTSQTSMFQ